MNAEAAPRAAAKKRTTRWAIAAAVVLLIAILAIAVPALLRPKKSATADLATAQVERRTLVVLVSGTGSAVAADSVSVNPQISGTVKKLYVALGDRVSAGDKLYRISSDDVETQMLKAKASLLQSKQSLEQARKAAQEGSAQVYSAKTQRIQAQQSLDELSSQPTTTPGRANKISIAKRQLTSAKKSVTSAKSGLAAAELGVDAAEANLTSSQQSYNDAVTATEDTLVTAPSDGVITALPISVGSDVAAGSTSSASGSSGSSSGSGASAASGSSSSSSASSAGSSIIIADLEDLAVDVSVSEVDVPSVSIGQTSTVTFDALPGTVFVAAVHSISPNGTSSSGVVNYTVELRLKSQDERLKPDMTATADINTAVAANVLAVPNTAVKTKDGAKYVVVLGQGGATANKPVKVGLSDDSYTEIKSGITAGEAVLTGSVTTSSTSSPRGGFITGGGPPGAGGPGGN